MTKFELPKLNFSYSSYEPFCDAKTMEIHHTKHHQAYVDNLNKALEKHAELEGEKLISILEKVSTLPADIRQLVINNGGGHYNHTFFFAQLDDILNGIHPLRSDPEVVSKINSQFGGFSELKVEFEKQALARFGSGWVWVIKKEDGSLAVTSTANQNNTLMDFSEVKGLPILALDVWEHAYYLKYQNRRVDYVRAFFEMLKI